MTPKLLKQLKDAGWPTRKFYVERGGDHPSLDELIESLGDDFRSLKNHQIGREKWQASCYSRMTVYGYGENPEEAVAKLWLELNKKDEN